MNPQPLTLDSLSLELIMWDGESGTAHLLGRGTYTMSPRDRALTLALLKLAASEIESAGAGE